MFTTDMSLSRQDIKILILYMIIIKQCFYYFQVAFLKYINNNTQYFT